MMARATVFIDDYVQGNLPQICAATGVPTTAHLRLRTAARPRSNLWLLLVLFGPIAWLALAVILSRDSGELRGILPLSEEAWEQEQATRRYRKRRGWILIGGGLVLALVFQYIAVLVPFPMLALMIRLSFVVALFASAGLLILWALNPASSYNISLDASGRWVEIDGIHPNLVAAIERGERRPTRV